MTIPTATFRPCPRADRRCLAVRRLALYLLRVVVARVSATASLGRASALNLTVEAHDAVLMSRLRTALSRRKTRVSIVTMYARLHDPISIKTSTSIHPHRPSAMASLSDEYEDCFYGLSRRFLIFSCLSLNFQDV